MSDNKLNPNNNNISKLTASGSATGTTRNKVALQPGFSLVGWIRLTNSGADLTGTKGKRFPVTVEELKKHNTKDDCWIAIRGKVYNITKYLDYHPGGVPELIRGAGIDGTKLFDEYHPWVNIEQLLAKCYIGPLKSPTLDFNPFELAKKLPLFKEESEEREVKVETKVVPRFDWIQKAKDLMVYFYTKAFCNPGITLTRIDDKEYEVAIYIGYYSHTYKFNFLKALKFPPKVFINHESGKIEINFDKVQEEVWTNLGIFEKTKTLKSDEADYPSWTECNAIKAQFFNHDSFELILRPNDENKIILLPIGYHVSFKLASLDAIRNYTPIPSNFLNDEESSTSYDLHFLIKKYDQGQFSKHLIDDERKEILSISQQKGSLDLNRLKDHTKFLLLAAGSGITPFLQLIPQLINFKKVESIHLLFFNKTSKDIWCKEKLNELSRTEKRFKVDYILSEPDDDWSGESGRIRKELIEKFIKDVSFALMCGNAGFNRQSLKILDEFKIEIHCFDG
jgi:cytochrome-b5 reductase